MIDSIEGRFISRYVRVICKKKWCIRSSLWGLHSRFCTETVNKVTQWHEIITKGKGDRQCKVVYLNFTLLTSNSVHVLVMSLCKGSKCNIQKFSTRLQKVNLSVKIRDTLYRYIYPIRDNNYNMFEHKSANHNHKQMFLIVHNYLINRLFNEAFWVI